MIKYCNDCRQSFESEIRNKQFCPACTEKHWRESQARYNRSEKRKKLARVYRSKHPKTYPRICPICGGGMHQDAHDMCKTCFVKYLKNRLPEEHPQWKGGRTFTEGGYVFIRQPSHPHAQKKGYVMEHILVWEQANGKPLPNGWIIHHLNGIKHDNRPVNLVSLPNWKHYLVLEAKAKRIQELEALLNHQHQLL